MLVFTLLITPSLLGFLIKKLLKLDNLENSALCFSVGFLVMVAEFAIVCYPAVFLKTPFHVVCYVTCIIYILESITILLWLIVSYTKKLSQRRLFTNDHWLSSLRSPSFWTMTIICGIQIVRLIVLEPAEMRDSKSYGALIIDILQSDRLFTVNPEDGTLLSSFRDMPLKFSLSPWYPFQAMLARISHMHPLIINNTVLPAFILLLHYMILFSLGYHLFAKDSKKAFWFTALCAFIQEITLFCHTPTLIKLVWPAWGKGILSMTVIPAILIIYMLYTDNSSVRIARWIIVLLLLLTIAGCSMSTMAAVVIPIELGLLGLIWAIRRHSAHPLLYSILACSPSVLYLLGYYYLSSI